MGAEPARKFTDETIGDATLADSSSATSATAGPAPGSLDVILEPGTLLGGRYEILEMLGIGGMGAVYKARDRELDRTIALKVIRPDLARNPEILQRFKQELLTARQVTHKNVVRIFDLAEADGIKFITMEHIAGHDLRRLLADHGKLPYEEAVNIMAQVCAGVGAAHAEGVIHRDLKPGNIMRDAQGRVVVMDFGLARTVTGDGMTKTGAMLGTVEYMSPEQALGKHVDPSSDVFTLGLIFYELLTGNVPFKADSMIASLVKRTQERAAPVSSLDNSIPRALSGIVSKCLETDSSLRYQNAGQVLADLEAWQGKGAAPSTAFPALTDIRRWAPRAWPWIALAAVLLVLAVVGIRYRDKLLTRTPAQQATVKPEVSLAILPFRNASGDPSLDWLGSSLADMLSTDVGQSARLRTVSPNRVHQIFSDLKISSSAVLDPATIRRVADFSSADRVVWGQYAKFGDQIRVDATLQDLKNDRAVPLKIEVASEKEIPGAVDKLAESIRQNLALSADVLQELKATSFQPSSKSVEALRDYNLGVSLQREGKNLEAEKQFEASTREDPTFALAFSKLAQTYAVLGYDNQAEQAAQKAADLSQNLPEAEKYLIAAIRAQISKNFPEAIKAYENLAKVSPDNSDVQSALARLYEDSGDLAKAGEYNQKILAANPKDITATLAVARLAIKSGNPQGSLEPLNRALSLSIQVDNQEQKAAALHSMGTAYRILNKPDEAQRNYQEALTIRRQIGQKRGIASSQNELARVEVLRGNNKAALADFQQALEIRRDIGDKRGLGDTLIDLGNFYNDHGDHDQALKMYKESLQIQRDIGNENLQAACLNNIGAVYYEKAQYEDARTYYQQALQLQEKAKSSHGIAESVHNLADISVRVGDYDQAVAQYMRALELRRSQEDARGAAIESYTLGMMFDYQGRFGDAISAKQEALKTFADLKDKTFWMAEIQGGYAEALILAGRGGEAKAYLNSALSLARELKNDGMLSQALAFEGDAAYYSGDAKSARASYEQALQAAIRSKEPDKILMAKVALVKLTLQGGHAQQAIASLRPLMQQADDLGLKHISVDCSVSLAEAMIENHDYAHARQELERTLLRTDRLGLKPLTAQTHYLLGNILRTSGNQTEAQQHYRNALQLLDGMRKNPGADKLLQRSDFKTIYDESTRWAKAS